MLKKKVIPTLSILVLSFILVGRATPAAAADGVSIDAGYQFLDISSGGSSQSVPLGFTAGVAVPLSSPWNVVGDLGWSRKSLTVCFTATTFAGGLRYAPTTMSSFMPYVQAVAGVAMDKTSVNSFGSATANNFMVQPGVGGTFAAGNLKGFVEVDYRRVQVSGSPANDFVARAGVVFVLGK